MTDLEKIIYTGLTTMTSGVVVFVLGQLVIKAWIEPLQEFARLRAEIAAALIYYANVGPGLDSYYVERLKQIQTMDEPLKRLYTTRYDELIFGDWHRQDEASQKLRSLAGRLLAQPNVILSYQIIRFFIRRLPSRNEISRAYTELIGFSNSTHDSQTGASNQDRIIAIAEKLRLTVILDQYGIHRDKK